MFKHLNICTHVGIYTYIMKLYYWFEQFDLFSKIITNKNLAKHYLNSSNIQAIYINKVV